jgi:hypothetical protein
MDRDIDEKDWKLTPHAAANADCCGTNCCGTGCCGTHCCATP